MELRKSKEELIEEVISGSNEERTEEVFLLLCPGRFVFR
jgi:hypothetical protein